MSLEGKVAVVTGGGRGIGRGYVLGLVGQGAKVVIADIIDEDGKNVVSEAEAAGGEALFVNTDVSKSSETQAMAAAATERFGGIDILVNNAGLFAGLPAEKLEVMDEDLFDRVMAINVKGVWLCIRAALPSMRQRGGGAVVNQASTAAWLCNPTRLSYNVSKAAVVATTKTLAKELAPDGIRVNSLAPGPTDTEALKDVPSEILDRVVASQCIKRLATPDDMVNAMLFLVNPQSAMITGQCIVVDGGTVMLG